MTTKADINKIVVPDLTRPALGDPDKRPRILGQIRSASPVEQTGGGSGLASPLNMVITAVSERSIPVPVGATEVIVHDASEFELTDADGNVFVVQSVTWPA